ncbi:class I SAM-dependent methyltransferase, partial|nr:class I SAM-dependent methyltransferase [Escherichia coli]
MSDEYINDKTNKVTEWIRTLSPDCLIDVGANNGYFSLIASAHAKRVIAVEMDHDCINQLYGKIKAQRIANLTTIIADLTQPTPGIGWENEEKTALMKRIGEKGDMVLGLALVHHLCISKNIPLAFVAKLFADITNKQAIVEFVPKTDEKVQAMLRHREDIFDDYTE